MLSCCYLKASRCLFSLINFCIFEAIFLHVSIDLRSPLLSIFCFVFSLQGSIPVFILSPAFAQLLPFYCFVTFKYNIIVVVAILHCFHLLLYSFHLSAALGFLFPVRHTFDHEKKLTSILISAPVQSCFCCGGVTNPFGLTCWSNELRSATAACSHSAAVPLTLWQACARVWP